MESFVKAKEFVNNPHYYEQRTKYLNELDIKTIDEPIVGIIFDLAKIPYCFTLQSCYGHFLYENQKDERNIAPLPITNSVKNFSLSFLYELISIIKKL